MRRAVFAAALVLAACGQGAAEQLPLAEVLATAGDQFDALESVRFEITVEGTPVFFDDEGTLAANSAQGQFDAPESFQAIVDVMAFGLSTQIGAISIGPDRWVSDPVTGAFQLLPIEVGFDPRLLFDPDEGVGATVRELDATLEGYDGTYRISGVVGGPTVKVLTAGLIGEGELDVTLLIDGDSLQISELQFETSNDRGRSDWSIVFSEYDEPVTITPPE